jgi:hypothetical protein
MDNIQSIINSDTNIDQIKLNMLLGSFDHFKYTELGETLVKIITSYMTKYNNYIILKQINFNYENKEYKHNFQDGPIFKY